MDSSKTKKKWVSSRLVKKKEELGIETKPDDLQNTKEKKPSKRVKKVFKKNDSKEDSKRGSYRNKKNGSKKSSKFNSNKGKKNNHKRGSKKTSHRRHTGPKHVVRISNLPDNVSVNELNYLVSEWGDIGNINIKKYTNYDGTITNCYIDFYNEEEAKYFVEALNNTPFDCLIISVQIMDFSLKD